MTLEDLKFRASDCQSGETLTFAKANEILLSRLRKCERVYGRQIGGKMRWQAPEPWERYGDLVAVIIEVGARPQPKAAPLPTGYPYAEISRIELFKK